MNHRSLFPKTILGLAAASAAALACAQAPSKNGLLHYESNIGSFKFFNGDGTVDFHFKGTVLIREFQGTPTVSGNVRKEYDSHNRLAYFGQGEFKFTGHFNALQWFGTDMKGDWNGRGGFRVYGDYDQNLNTGWYWYDNDQAHKVAWPTQGANTFLPQPEVVRTQPVFKLKKK